MTDSTQLQTNIPLDPFTMLTNEDLDYIKLLIDERIKAHLDQSKRPENDYHTVREIRRLIRGSLSKIRDEFVEREFELSVFRYFLAKQTILRPADEEIVSKGDSKSTPRWHQQVLSAIDERAWPETPIVRVKGKRGIYKLVAAR